jgi:hypothetical protein
LNLVCDIWSNDDMLAMSHQAPRWSTRGLQCPTLPVEIQQNLFELLVSMCRDLEGGVSQQVEVAVVKISGRTYIHLGKLFDNNDGNEHHFVVVLLLLPAYNVVQNVRVLHI